ncbi:hypothetical protein ACHHY8_02240 [Enterobacter cloacae complex sp. 2024EL-00215]|uniref:hypothetical protein n=1 Tax=unclassified Enterobacter cloacae complex TaxID=2757714 RepID=UPI00375159F7
MMNAKELELNLSDSLQREDILKEKLAESKREFRAADATIENLQMQLEKMAAESAALKIDVRKLATMMAEDFNDPEIITVWCDKETPATDAFLAEVRAQGVEMFAEIQKEYVRNNRKELDSMTRAAYCGSAVDAERFAAQLRKGVQS